MDVKSLNLLEEQQKISEDVFSSPLYSTPKKNNSDISINLMEFYTPIVKGKDTTPRSVRVSGKKKALTPQEKNNLSPKASTPKSATRKIRKSPTNSLLNVVGVKELFSRKSPRNDLTKIPSIRRLMKTPPRTRVKKPTIQRPVKSPKNDLTDVRGVKEMFLVQDEKSPLVRGVKRILARSPRNDLTDVRGVRNLLTVQKSPKNDLTDVRGVRNLLTTPKSTQSPKNDLRRVSGLKELFTTPPSAQVEPAVASPALRKRTRGAVGTPKAVDSPLRRGRSSMATPQTRALRTRNNTVTEIEEAEVGFGF